MILFYLPKMTPAGVYTPYLITEKVDYYRWLYHIKQLHKEYYTTFCSCSIAVLHEGRDYEHITKFKILAIHTATKNYYEFLLYGKVLL